MNSHTLFLILLTIVCNHQTNSASIPNDSYDYYYDDYTSDKSNPHTECSCQNNGACVLDFCVCQPDFTGRHCEIDLKSAQAKLGCGRLINGESEFIECARCKCTDQFLTCTALATMTCDRFSASDVNKLKGGDLNELVELMHDIETEAYGAYVKEYLDGKEYDVSVIDIENDREMKNKANRKSSESKKLIVFQQNKRVVSLYFPYTRFKDLSSSSSPSQFGFNFYTVTVFYFSYFLIRKSLL